MKLAERMSRIGVESAFDVLVRARALEAQGRSVIHLEIGEPDFPTPPHVVEAAKTALDQGWTYVSDLAGCTVVDNGQELGIIEDVQFGAGEAPLLIVAGKTGKRFDVPFAEAYLEAVDTTRKQVRMKLPEGLLEINAPMTAEEKQQQKREG